MRLSEARQKLMTILGRLYDSRESSAINELVLEKITGWGKIERVIHKDEELSFTKEKLLEIYLADLSRGRPVQYVLGEAWFCGMRFMVDENVLIPRPETEELVQWVVSDLNEQTADRHTYSNYRGKLKMMDVGTGSGCIAVTIASKFPAIDVQACDISNKSLLLAHQNAAANGVSVQFGLLDVLNKGQRKSISDFDVIVSNPPYIPLIEKETLHVNVVNFEPHEALFVGNNDPLVFYEAIADLGMEKLSRPGSIYVETHEKMGANVKKLFLDKGFQNIAIRKDLHGKQRLVKATLLL
ncbi:MAG TPA: peptide chain release factor N(5)-glutamine methyltransferase [Puia sp.]|nr:peptide chain release factor N(5)-glutamine methyltransferase [Puia sp.]